MKGISIVVSLLAIAAAVPVRAQYDYYNNPAPPPAPYYGQTAAGPQLEQLLEPIALYPDPLIAQILPAATQPSQIALAANYLAQGGDPNQIDAQPWDSSVKAVAHYPQVLQMMDSNLAWTAQLGQAFATDPTDVMNTIQVLRQQAMQVGNLQSSPQETVINEGGEIEIVPANPDVIYVPEYNPGLVYFDPGVGITWGIGFHIGRWLDHDFDWHDHRVVVWDRDHPRPENWWHERPQERHTVVARAPEWHPAERRPEQHNFFAPQNRGDRGYAPAPVHEARPAPVVHESHPAPVVHESHPAPVVHETAPAPTVHEARPAPAPAVHAAPERPRALSERSAPEARAASSRGMASRGAAGGGGGHSGGGGGHH